MMHGVAGAGQAAQQQQRQGLTRAQLRQEGSRHRHRHEPPPTPEGYWDMGFMDSLVKFVSVVKIDHACRLTCVSMQASVHNHACFMMGSLGREHQVACTLVMHVGGRLILRAR